MFTHTNDAAVWQIIHHLRKDLVSFLETLSDEEWNTASLCEGWRVRDVVSHLILEYHYTFSNSWLDFIRCGGNTNAFIMQTAIRLGEKPASELLDQFSRMTHERQKPRSVSSLNVLVDLLVHEQDIRIPLGKPKDMDMDSLKLIFSHWEPGKYNFGEKITGLDERLKGLQFVITDLSVIKGDGAEVNGNAHDILLAATGRSVAVSQLSGVGADILKQRLS